MDYSKPLYIFVLATRHNHWDFDINRVLKEPLPPANDPSSIRPCVSGSSLALGCWDQPKEAVPTSEGYYVLIVNNEIDHGSSFKWLDLTGRYEPAFKDDQARSWEPTPDNNNRSFDIGRPQPGEAGVCLCMSWGDPEGKVVYFPLPKDCEVIPQSNIVQEEQIKPETRSDAEVSPTKNGPASAGNKTPKRDLIPDHKSASSGRRSTRKRMSDSFRSVRKGVGNLFSCTSSRTQDE